MPTYSKEFKEAAVCLSFEIGIKKAAAQLKIPCDTLTDWRNRSKDKPKKRGDRELGTFLYQEL